MRTSDILEPKGVPNNYALYVVALISCCIRPIISMQTYTLHVIILLAFWQPPSCLHQVNRNFDIIGGKTGEPLFATPCCNTSRATWSTSSEPPHMKPFFEVLSFSALFGTGCCCQLVCFEYGALHFRLPLYTRNGQVGENVLLLWCLALVWLAAVVNLFVLNL